MTRTSQHDRQHELPFAEAEMSADHRKKLLGLALMQVDADLHLSQFVQWVYNTTGGGTAGEFRKSYDELAARPWGLCCSRGKARSTVARARDKRLVEAVEHRDATGAQAGNGYRIDWRGVRQLLGLAEPDPPPAEPPPTDATMWHPPVTIEHPPALSEQGGCSRKAPYRGNNSFPSPVKNSGTGAGTGSGMVTVERQEDELAELVARYEVLSEAYRTRVDPHPEGPGKAALGVFAQIELKHLRRPQDMIAWFRRQLAAPEPVTGPTEAELLLVLAAARYATKLPDNQVRNRVGLFVRCVSRRYWRRLLPQLQGACDELSEALVQGMQLTGAMYVRPFTNDDQEEQP